MKKFLMLMTLILSGSAVAAPITEMPERLGQFTENLDTVSATFRQTKIIPDSVKKFSSSGQVKFHKGIGFIWKQQKPNAQTFISTTDRYCINGRVRDLTSMPYFYYVRSIIDDTLNGDVDALNTVFFVDYNEYNANQWQLTARPRLTSVRDFVQEFVMYGTITDLDKIVMTYQDGTIIIIEFKRMNTEIPDEINC